jgi:predicted lipoprotein with Yx(FWY)xxD motif
MTMRGMVALFSLVLTVALAGCSSGTYGQGKHAGQLSSTDSAPSSVKYAPNRSAPRPIGRVVTTVAGATLYTFDEDQNGQSSCYDDCAKHWPPLIALSAAKAYYRMSLTPRADGQQQWAHDGKPLYTYVNDTMPGDTNGDNVGNVWHVIR